MIEQRKSRRFVLKMPVEVTRAGAADLSSPGETRNLSSSGVLFCIPARVSIGDSIEYVITLPVIRDRQEPVRLRCQGKVVRQGDGGAAAVTLERYEFIRDGSHL